jgi:hypothetical protein
VYDAHGSGRILWLDGPWWLAAVALAALSVLNFAPGHWKWLAIPVIAAVAWVPWTLHWVLGLGRSVGAFRDGYRGQ